MHSFQHAERAKTATLLRQLAQLRDIAYKTRGALQAIAAMPESPAQALACTTLDELQKEYGDEFGRT